MQLITVKYIGKAASIYTEYNGKKYTFGKANPTQDIPVEVYNYFQQLNNPFRDDLLPVGAKNQPEVKIVKKIDDIISDTEKEIEEIKEVKDDRKKRKAFK